MSGTFPRVYSFLKSGIDANGGKRSINLCFAVEMKPLSQICVINEGRNLSGKFMHAEECLLL